MKIVIAGGSGFLGKTLIKYLPESNEYHILTRGSSKRENNVFFHNWDGKSLGEWKAELEGADAIINLNGKSVDCRYNEKNKDLILSTRVDATRVIGRAIEQCENPPKVWINASSATIYKHTYGPAHDETSKEFGEGFSEDVCREWEAAFNEFDLPKTRQVITRISIVMGDGSAFKVISNLAKYGLGGTQGNGKQMVSWVHEKDYARLIEFILEHEELKGIVNAAAPNPIPNKEFMKATRKSVGAKVGLPQPAWMIKLGAWFIGTEPILVLKSRCVISKQLEDFGFKFKYPEIFEALKSIN